MQSVFQQVPRRLAETQVRIAEWISQGRHPVDAVFLSAALAIQLGARDAEETDPDYVSARKDLRYLSTSDLSRITSRLRYELTWLMRHGTSVLIALLEAIPHVYALQHGRPASLSDLYRLIPSAAREMLSNLTQVTGDYAVLIEQALSREERRLEVDGMTFYRLVFDPRCLVLRQAGGEELLDVHSVISEVVEERWSSEDASHYGCLAIWVPVEPLGTGKKQTVLSYMQGEIVRFMSEHWYPGLEQASEPLGDPSW